MYTTHRLIYVIIYLSVRNGYSFTRNQQSVKEIKNMEKKTGNIGVNTKWNMGMAVEAINNIKQTMIAEGNNISYIVYQIRDELKERNASRDFALKTGMSKASISKMIYAETTRELLDINSEVSCNTIYKLKPLMCAHVADLLNEGKSVSEIEHMLSIPDDTPDDTADDTPDTTADVTPDDTSDEAPDDSEETRSEIVAQIFEILNSYDIQKDDMKLLKMLIKGLR